MVKILEQAIELLCERARVMKKYVRYKNANKPAMNASQKRGYRDAAVYAKKYAKAMKVLG